MRGQAPRLGFGRLGVLCWLLRRLSMGRCRRQISCSALLHPVPRSTLLPRSQHSSGLYRDIDAPAEVLAARLKQVSNSG